jgi:hypothetical protein
MKKVNWALVQSSCIVGVIVVNLAPGSGPAVDARHARASLVFRLVVGTGCLLGAVVAGVLNKRAKAAEPAVDSSVPSLPAGARAITVTYRNTREAARRCELYTLLNRNTILAVFAAFGLAGAVPAVSWVAKLNPAAALLAFPVLHLLCTSVFLAYITVIQLAMLRTKFPKPDSVRVCTSSLTADGFQDVTPDKVIPIPWAEVREVREAGGDVYFWKWASGCYIPRGAFANRDAARRFHRAAVTLWRSRGAQWPDDVPAVIDETAHPAGKTGGAPPDLNDNPYAAPRAPLAPAHGWDGPSAHTGLLLKAAGLLAVEYLVILPVVLMR